MRIFGCSADFGRITDIPMDATPALNPRSLGQAFKAERMALGLSQQAVAKSAGFRRQTIVDLRR